MQIFNTEVLRDWENLLSSMTEKERKIMMKAIVQDEKRRTVKNLIGENSLREYTDIETEKPLVDIPASPMKQNEVKNKTTLPEKDYISDADSYTCLGGSVTGYTNFPPIPYFHDGKSSFSGNKYFVRIHPKAESIPTPVPNNPDLKTIGYFVDAYIIAKALGIISHPVFHAFKKIAYAGKRGGKGYRQDIQEAIDALQRELELTK